MAHFVVVGGGQAGASLVAKLRSEGFDGIVTLIGEEPVAPYQRPPLSKGYLLGEITQERLHLRPNSFYEEQEITLRLGQKVDSLDPEARTVTVDGEVVDYDELALCTGSHPRRLPEAIGGDLDGVFVVRTVADVDAMEPLVREGGRALIVGGGYIGLEATAVAAKKGMQVTLVEMADRILQRVAAPQTSDYFRELHRSHGVDIREGIGLTRLSGEDGRVSGAVLSDGSELAVDMVVVGVGIAPATELAEAAGIEIDNGIKVDALGRTSAPHVWAAGDCTSFPYRGRRIRLESVPNAIDQAEIVAQNMLGAGKDYVATPWFWSDQYDTKLQIAGLNTGYDHVEVRQGEHVSFWYFRGAELLAVDAMNDARGYMIGKRLIEMGRTLTREQVNAPDKELKGLLRG